MHRADCLLSGAPKMSWPAGWQADRPAPMNSQLQTLYKVLRVLEGSHQLEDVLVVELLQQLNLVPDSELLGGLGALHELCSPDVERLPVLHLEHLAELALPDLVQDLEVGLELDHGPDGQQRARRVRNLVHFVVFRRGGFWQYLYVFKFIYVIKIMGAF